MREIIDTPLYSPSRGRDVKGSPQGGKIGRIMIKGEDVKENPKRERQEIPPLREDIGGCYFYVGSGEIIIFMV